AYIWQKYHQAVLANICKLISKQPEAEDILQEVFITLWQKRQTLTPNQSIAGWLFTTSYYKSLEQLKRSIRLSFDSLDEQVASLATETPTNFEQEYAEKLTVLNAAIESLPPRKKSAFTLCRLEGKTYEEAAAELGLSTETVKDYVKYSAKMLREYIVTKSPAMQAISASCLIVFLA
ncbi:MAG TPA: sigma-70 family RNA polymerase sigma factor, partial [Niastella sp.]